MRASLAGAAPLAALFLTSATTAAPPDIALFARAASLDERSAREALEQLAAAWSDDCAALIVDLARLMKPPASSPAPGDRGGDAGRAAGAASEEAPGPPRAPFLTGVSPAREDPSARVRARLIAFLERQTGQRFGQDLSRWRRWTWSRPYAPHPEYAAFKRALLGRIDPRMEAFFPSGVSARIRLDEVEWGGVGVNGIPPLVRPCLLPAADARYLGEKDVVFGVALNGEARAYPKRILAWHELCRDRVGGVELTVVYCTLCGSVVPYGSEAGGALRTFGTSGLLYRSNKLMFDEETLSLWSSAEGRPVIGPLVGSGLELRAYPVVTTTWREWRSLHPQTTVLSLDTGFTRDYSEGAAYRDYFATDRLMFAVPGHDRRLRNKDEVLALLVAPADGGERRPLAIAVGLLRREPLLPVNFAGRDLLVVTTPDGASRVYETGRQSFARHLGAGRVEDTEGRRYTADEDALRAEADGASFPRLAARRAFWFGWHAQFPDTELISNRQHEARRRSHLNGW